MNEYKANVPNSQRHTKLFPTREYFGNAVAEDFNAGSGNVQGNYFACALEELEGGGKHFHAVLKLHGLKCWLPAKNALN